VHTIKLQIQDDLYELITSKGYDINAKIKEFLHSLANDEYPSISTQEARKRVGDAVDRYKNNTGSYVDQEQYVKHINATIDNLKSKYANN